MALLFLFLLLPPLHNTPPFNFPPNPCWNWKSRLTMVFWITGFCEYNSYPFSTICKLDHLPQVHDTQVSVGVGLLGNRQMVATQENWVLFKQTSPPLKWPGILWQGTPLFPWGLSVVFPGTVLRGQPWANEEVVPSQGIMLVRSRKG